MRAGASTTKIEQQEHSEQDQIAIDITRIA
jgi:hypothetical protein